MEYRARLPLLQSVGGDFRIRGNDNLDNQGSTYINCNQLMGLSGISKTPDLTTMWHHTVYNYTQLVGTLKVHDNPYLATIDLPQLQDQLVGVLLCTTTA